MTKIIKFGLIASLAAILAAPLATQLAAQMQTPSPAAVSTEPANLSLLKREIVAYVESGRYAADLNAAYASAQALLANRIARAGDAKLAIVLDVDETALSNLVWLRANDWGLMLQGPCPLENDRGPCGFLAWAERAEGKPIEGALTLVKFAKEKGVAVFFITGRRESMREATEKNLKAAGFAWDGVILQPNDVRVKSAADYKAPERKKIEAKGYTIALNVGDQQSDLDGGAAEVIAKLPNPFYHLP